MSSKQGVGFITRLRIFCFMVAGRWKRPLLKNKYCIRCTADPGLFWNDGWRKWVGDGITIFTERHRSSYPLPANGQWLECNKLTERPVTQEGYLEEIEQPRKVACL